MANKSEKAIKPIVGWEKKRWGKAHVSGADAVAQPGRGWNGWNFIPFPILEARFRFELLSTATFPLKRAQSGSKVAEKRLVFIWGGVPLDQGELSISNFTTVTRGLAAPLGRCPTKRIGNSTPVSLSYMDAGTTLKFGEPLGYMLLENSSSPPQNFILTQNSWR